MKHYFIRTSFTCFTEDIVNDKPTMVHIIAWCCNATSHYLNQCWQITGKPYSVIIRTVPWLLMPCQIRYVDRQMRGYFGAIYVVGNSILRTWPKCVCSKGKQFPSTIISLLPRHINFPRPISMLLLVMPNTDTQGNFCNLCIIRWDTIGHRCWKFIWMKYSPISRKLSKSYHS